MRARSSHDAGSLRRESLRRACAGGAIRVNLEFRAATMALVTLEGVALGTVDAAFAQAHGLYDTCCLVFEVDAAEGTTAADAAADASALGAPSLAAAGGAAQPAARLVNARFVKLASPARSVPDSWSRILFQSLARQGRSPGLERLLAAALS